MTSTDADLRRYESALQHLIDKHADAVRRDPPKKTNPNTGHAFYCSDEPCGTAWMIAFLQRHRPESADVVLERVKRRIEGADEYGRSDDEYTVLARAAISAYEDVPNVP